MAPLLELTNIREHRQADMVYYCVYNSRGSLALYTSNREFAEKIAREFLLKPQTTEVIVRELPPRSPKRV